MQKEAFYCVKTKNPNVKEVGINVFREVEANSKRFVLTAFIIEPKLWIDITISFES